MVALDTYTVEAKDLANGDGKAQTQNTDAAQGKPFISLLRLIGEVYQVLIMPFFGYTLFWLWADTVVVACTFVHWAKEWYIQRRYTRQDLHLCSRRWAGVQFLESCLMGEWREDEDLYNLWKGWSYPDDAFFLEHLLIEGARAHYRQWGPVEFCAVCWWRSHQLLDISCLSQHAYFSGKEDIFCLWFSGSWPDIGLMVFWNVWWALMLMSLITPNSSCI